MKFISLASARDVPWTDTISELDGLPLRDSGSWIEEKHKRLSYFAEIFATAMKPSVHKKGWANRIYLELFSGPGRCWVSSENREEEGSPQRIIGHDFTRFIFVDIDTKAARALEKRLSAHPNADKVEIWNGDCADVVDQLGIPSDALMLAFIDPTGIGHAPFDLIRKLRTKTRCDILINIQHGMGIKMNLHQYLPDADEDCALTQFLGDDSWKKLKGLPPGSFFIEFLKNYRAKLAALGFKFSDNQVLIKNDRKLPLYLLLFASGHPKGQDFWNKALAGSDPQGELPL